jgi:hypothetical protein
MSGCAQTASGRAFKPQWLTAASVQLAAGATKLRAQGVAGGTAKFSGMAALKGRSSAQLLGAYVDPSVGSQKLCLAVGLHWQLSCSVWCLHMMCACLQGVSYM